MQCPICNVELRSADRQGIEIDCCPECCGVWIAREELDRILVQPTPFDINWGYSNENADELPDRKRVRSESKQVAGERRGQKPGFWTNLFGCPD
jgi:Zn-finger nucleic acid-binding protein